MGKNNLKRLSDEGKACEDNLRLAEQRKNSNDNHVVLIFELTTNGLTISKHYDFGRDEHVSLTWAEVDDLLAYLKD